MYVCTKSGESWCLAINETKMNEHDERLQVLSHESLYIIHIIRKVIIVRRCSQRQTHKVCVCVGHISSVVHTTGRKSWYYTKRIKFWNISYIFVTADNCVIRCSKEESKWNSSAKCWGKRHVDYYTYVWNEVLARTPKRRTTRELRCIQCHALFKFITKQDNWFYSFMENRWKSMSFEFDECVCCACRVGWVCVCVRRTQIGSFFVSVNPLIKLNYELCPAVYEF